MGGYPHQGQLFIEIEELYAVLLLTIQQKVEMIVHQAEGDDADCYAFCQARQNADRYPVDSGTEFNGRFEQDVRFKTFTTAI